MKGRKYLDELGHWDGKHRGARLAVEADANANWPPQGRAMSETAKQAVRHAETFLARSDVLGWTARELFGLHPVPERPAPTFRRLSRYDSTGLVWLLQGRPVVALTETKAAIQSAGAVLIYRKHRKPAFGPLGNCLHDLWGPTP